MNSGNGNNALPQGKMPILMQVVVEVRADNKIYVVPKMGLNPDDPKHAAAILDMLCTGAAAFARNRVSKFEAKLITAVEKPGIQVVQG